MMTRKSHSLSLALVLALGASVRGESASPTYLLRNARLDGTRMATGAAPNTIPMPTTAYSLRSIYLGAPLQGDAASPGFSLQLLGGTWIRQPGDPYPDPSCLYTPNFCSGPGTWNAPPVNPPPPTPQPEADGLFKVSGMLWGPDRTVPLGPEGPIALDVRIEFFAVPTGGTAVHAEAHTSTGGNPVSVDKGRFSLTLGADSTGALESVVSANPALYAQFVMQLGSGPAEVLVPRLPMTQSMLSGLPSVLQGAADPTATAPRGTYFRNTASGSTWIRMTSNWVLIAD